MQMNRLDPLIDTYLTNGMDEAFPLMERFAG